MEENKTPQKNENKRLIIICATIILVAVMALLGVIILKNNSTNPEYEIYGDLSGIEMTYEDFTYGMKEDLSADVEQQVKDLYDEFLEANENNDQEAITAVFNKLDKLDVYDEEMMGNMEIIEMTPEELAQLDPDGDGVIVFEGDELPEGFTQEGEN